MEAAGHQRHVPGGPRFHAVDAAIPAQSSPDRRVPLPVATTPANPYGAALKSPTAPGRGPTRTVGATVVLVDGALVAYLARGDRQLLTWLPEPEPQRSQAARAIANALIARARSGGETPRG